MSVGSWGLCSFEVNHRGHTPVERAAHARIARPLSGRIRTALCRRASIRQQGARAALDGPQRALVQQRAITSPYCASEIDGRCYAPARHGRRRLSPPAGPRWRLPDRRRVSPLGRAVDAEDRFGNPASLFVGTPPASTSTVVAGLVAIRDRHDPRGGGEGEFGDHRGRQRERSAVAVSITASMSRACPDGPCTANLITASREAFTTPPITLSPRPPQGSASELSQHAIADAQAPHVRVRAPSRKRSVAAITLSPTA